MKIIRDSTKAAVLNKVRQIANKKCDICPCCGERKSKTEYFKRGIYNKGLMPIGARCWVEGIFRTRCVQVDRYTCDTCGAIWESDPYEY